MLRSILAIPLRIMKVLFRLAIAVTRLAVVTLGMGALALGTTALLLAVGQSRLPEWMAPALDVCWANSAFSMCTVRTGPEVEVGLQPFEFEDWIKHIVPATNCALGAAGLAPEPWCRMPLRLKLEEVVQHALANPDFRLLFAGVWIVLSLFPVLCVTRTCRRRNKRCVSAVAEQASTSAGASDALSSESQQAQASTHVRRADQKLTNLADCAKEAAKVSVKQSRKRMESPGARPRARAPLQEMAPPTQLKEELSELREKGIVGKILRSN